MTALKDQRIAALENENDELRERVRQLEIEVFGAGTWHCPVEFRLTPSEQKILTALVARERCSKEFLHLSTAKPGEHPEAALKIIDVWVCRIRKKIEPFGLGIQTLWGTGYTLSDADRACLLSWQDMAA